MTTVLFLRHPETAVDPDVPVADWELSAEGEERIQRLLGADWVHEVDRIYSSPEHKALRNARAVADETGCDVVECGELREVDRSGEGFIEDHDEYVGMVHTFLRQPSVPFDWEDRREVEQRTRAFLDRLHGDGGTVLVVGHGMQFTTMLAPVSDQDPVRFWEELGFGELVRHELAELRAAWG